MSFSLCYGIMLTYTDPYWLWIMFQILLWLYICLHWSILVFAYIIHSASALCSLILIHIDFAHSSSFVLALYLSVLTLITIGSDFRSYMALFFMNATCRVRGLDFPMAIGRPLHSLYTWLSCIHYQNIKKGHQIGSPLLSCFRGSNNSFPYFFLMKKRKKARIIHAHWNKIIDFSFFSFLLSLFPCLPIGSSCWDSEFVDACKIEQKWIKKMEKKISILLLLLFKVMASTDESNGNKRSRLSPFARFDSSL